MLGRLRSNAGSLWRNTGVHACLATTSPLRRDQSETRTRTTRTMAMTMETARQTILAAGTSPPVQSIIQVISDNIELIADHVKPYFTPPWFQFIAIVALFCLVLPMGSVEGQPIAPANGLRRLRSRTSTILRMRKPLAASSGLPTGFCGLSGMPVSFGPYRKRRSARRPKAEGMAMAMAMVTAMTMTMTMAKRSREAITLSPRKARSRPSCRNG